jgi:hypothetical protein
MTPASPFGPWVAGIAGDERKVQLRSIAVLVAAFCGSSAPAVGALRDAEADTTKSDAALAALDAIPTLKRRRLLSVFGAVTWPANRGVKP